MKKNKGGETFLYIILTSRRKKEEQKLFSASKMSKKFCYLFFLFGTHHPQSNFLFQNFPSDRTDNESWSPCLNHDVAFPYKITQEGVPDVFFIHVVLKRLKIKGNISALMIYGAGRHSLAFHVTLMQLIRYSIFFLPMQQGYMKILSVFPRFQDYTRL